MLSKHGRSRGGVANITGGVAIWKKGGAVWNAGVVIWKREGAILNNPAAILTGEVAVWNNEVVILKHEGATRRGGSSAEAQFDWGFELKSPRHTEFTFPERHIDRTPSVTAIVLQASH